MDRDLSPARQEIRGFGESLAGKFDRDYWHRHVAAREFPRELWAEIGAAGYLGMLVPEEQGGAERGLTELLLLVEGIAEAGLPLLTLITAPGLGLPAIAGHGSAWAREEVLPPLLAGRSTLAFAITEAAVGTNLLKLAVRAESDGERFVLSGTKSYTSLGDIAEHVLVLARTPGPQPGPQSGPQSGCWGFTLFLVPSDAPGLTCEAMDTRVPMPERQCTLRFEGVSLGQEHLVGDPGGGLAVLLPALVAERVVSGALSCGLGLHALGRAVERVRDRSVFGQPLGAHQGVQHPLARARIRIEGARLLLRQAAALADAGERADGVANMALWAAGEAGFEAADTALQVHGGHGYTLGADVLDDHQMARLLRSAPVNAESALNSVGELVLGLPRSY